MPPEPVQGALPPMQSRVETALALIERVMSTMGRRPTALLWCDRHESYYALQRDADHQGVPWRIASAAADPELRIAGVYCVQRTAAELGPVLPPYELARPGLYAFRPGGWWEFGPLAIRLDGDYPDREVRELARDLLTTKRLST